jgi:adenylate cyclase class IV
MPRNLELKVRCSPSELLAIRKRAERTNIGPFSRLRQVDTYFAVAHGRLKLREITSADGEPFAELIAYSRPDELGPRWSAYRRITVSAGDASNLRAALAETTGVVAVVAKTRDVAIHGRTRIHLDVVEGLGEFVELETVVGDGDDGGAAQELATIAGALGLGACATIAGSYADLIVHQRRNV